ncbi:hypothetical protein DV515_00007756 [Chloebia gouldiae]|uniref:Uncharacterized protein n=1 Tax=Chloebia gouldiae TaxID=44316 RepID=A0A3L8SHY3_CHLGU|nr:hypothetical protein DV515_00007756 [Chloebia gouldiae]
MCQIAVISRGAGRLFGLGCATLRTSGSQMSPRLGVASSCPGTGAPGKLMVLGMLPTPHGAYGAKLSDNWLSSAQVCCHKVDSCRKEGKSHATNIKRQKNDVSKDSLNYRLFGDATDVPGIQGKPVLKLLGFKKAVL